MSTSGSHKKFTAPNGATVVLLTREEQSGWYGVEVPGLPGCYSQGRTREEALANIREAIALYLGDRQDVPPPSEHLLDSVEVSVA